MKVIFRTYTHKDGTPDHGYYEILEHLNGNTEKDIVVRVDYDKKNDYSLDEEDFFFPSLKISKLKLNKLDDSKFEAEFTTKNQRTIVAFLISLGAHGNPGHSYQLCIGKKVFYIDGDGADYLESINGHALKSKLLSDKYKWHELYDKEDDKTNTITEEELVELVSESVKRVLKRL